MAAGYRLFAADSERINRRSGGEHCSERPAGFACWIV